MEKSGSTAWVALAGALLIACGHSTESADAGAAGSAALSGGSVGRGGTGGTGGAGPQAGQGGRTAAGSGGAEAGRDAPVPYSGGGPAPGNPDGTCTVPQSAALADSSTPTTVVGTGAAASCTAQAFLAAVAKGGVITFNCGSSPATITLDRPAKIVNDTGPEIVIDGGGRVTLSGGGKTRILYMNTCDPEQKWTTDHCDNQDHPRLTLQNLTFVDGNSKNEPAQLSEHVTNNDGGGAVWVRGGRLKIINSRFFRNVCADTGPDIGGAGVRVFSQYQNQPVYVVDSTFGGSQELGNRCSNGGAISSIGVSWSIYNSLFSYNRAVGNGGNPMQSGTPGGGSGGAIYNDGGKMTLSICGSALAHNNVVQHGSAIFFVSNDHTGDIVIDRSTITENTGGSWYPTYPQISNHGDTPISVSASTIE
jgi:hypothetical protein